MTLEDIRYENGLLPSFAWPGGYPILYLCADGGTLCPDCANGENGSEAANPSRQDPECLDDDQWRVVAWYIHYEGQPELCDHCGVLTESAYGDPEDEEE